MDRNSPDRAYLETRANRGSPGLISPANYFSINTYRSTIMVDPLMIFVITFPKP